MGQNPIVRRLLKAMSLIQDRAGMIDSYGEQWGTYENSDTPKKK
jgi:hypothetical protein